MKLIKHISQFLLLTLFMTLAIAALAHTADMQYQGCIEHYAEQGKVPLC